MTSQATRRRLLDETLADVTHARQLLDGSLGLIDDSLAGHPRAIHYDTDGATSRLWCFVHERDHARCEYEGLACGGTPVTGSDPTGNAATTPDQAAVARSRIDSAIQNLATYATVLAVELTAWSPPTPDMQRPDPRPVQAPEGWCTSCWRDNQYHEPVGVRPGGTAPYYTDLCFWCGRFRRIEGYLPPVELLHKRHSANPEISEADIARYRPKKASR